MSKVMKSFICRGCLHQLTTTGCTSVDIGISADLELTKPLGMQAIIFGACPKPVRKESEVAHQQQT